MEELRWFLGGLFRLVIAFLELCARCVGALSDEFGLGLPPPVIQIIGFLIGFLILYSAIVRLLAWKPKAFQPQPFPLKTADTPAQVVERDIANLGWLILRLIIVAIVLVIAMSRP